MTTTNSKLPKVFWQAMCHHDEHKRFSLFWYLNTEVPTAPVSRWEDDGMWAAWCEWEGVDVLRAQLGLPPHSRVIKGYVG